MNASSDPLSLSVYPTLGTFLSDQRDVLLLGVGFVLFFVVVRLSKMKDQDGQKLPPSFPAKAFFVLTHALLYIAIVLALFYSPKLLSVAMAITSGSSLKPFSEHVPLLAVVISGILFSIPQVKDAELDYALFLHSAQHRTVDEDRLREHLIICEFNPSDQERLLNENYLQQFNLYITERSDRPVHLGAFDAWRKVSAILRRLRENDATVQRTLSGEDRLQIAGLEAAHQRKTSLAVSIIRILNDLGSEAENSAKFACVTKLLSNTAHTDRERVLDAEVVAQTIIETQTSGETNAIAKPLRISEQQILQYVSQIENYFRVEYRLILKSLCGVAAKSIVRAGELIGNRLDDLKKAGFVGLGTVERVTLDRVIWVLLITWLVTFGLFCVPSFVRNGPPPRFVGIALTVASTFAIAALIGTVWGSRRSLTDCRNTPWSSYLTAGLFAVAGFFVVHALRYAVNPEAAVRRITEVFKVEAQTVTFSEYAANVGPFALMPFVIAIAICRLARVRQWPPWPIFDLPQRVKDGLTLGFLFLATIAAARVLHQLFGTAYATSQINPDEVRFYVFQAALFATGFCIGWGVVGDVRDIAYSQIVSPDSQRVSASLTARPV